MIIPAASDCIIPRWRIHCHFLAAKFQTTQQRELGAQRTTPRL